MGESCSSDTTVLLDFFDHILIMVIYKPYWHSTWFSLVYSSRRDAIATAVVYFVTSDKKNGSSYNE